MAGPEQVGGAQAQWQEFKADATKFGEHVAIALGKTPDVLRARVPHPDKADKIILGTSLAIGFVCPPVGLGLVAGYSGGILLKAGIGVCKDTMSHYKNAKAEAQAQKQPPAPASQSRQSVASSAVNTQDTGSTPAQTKPPLPPGPSPRASTPPATGGVATPSPAAATVAPTTSLKKPLDSELKNKIEQFAKGDITVEDLDKHLRDAYGKLNDKEMATFKKVINDNMGEIEQILGDKVLEFIGHSLLQDAEGTQLTAPWRGEEIGQIFYAAYCNLMYDAILNECIGTEIDMSKISFTDFVQKIAEKIETHPQHQELQKLHQAHNKAAESVQKRQEETSTTEGKVKNSQQFVVGAFALRVLTPRCTNAFAKNSANQQTSLATAYKQKANTLQSQANAYGAERDRTIKTNEPVETAAFNQLRDALFGRQSANPPEA